MSDRMHDHDTIGVRRGCVACAQTEADLARSRRAYQSRTHETAPTSAEVGAVDRPATLGG